MDQVTSLKNLAVLRLAVDITLRPDVMHKLMQHRPVFPRRSLDVWINVYFTLKVEVRRVNIPPSLLEEVLSHAMAIALKVMNLIKHHVNAFHLTETQMIRYLDSSVFTSGGLVDYLKLGRKLVENEQLNEVLKYRISCFYFLEGVIDSKPYIRNLISFSFWKILPSESRDCFLYEEPKDLEQIISERLQFADTNKGFSVRKMLNILKAAVISGSMLAVKYCWEKLEWSKRSNLLVRTCLSVVALIEVNDQIYHRSFNVLAPSDFYVDILSFLVSRMNDNQKEIFFQKDFAKYGRVQSLEYFLRWPHQKRFIEVCESAKNVLPALDFSYLILEIVRKLEPKFLKSTNILLWNICIEEYRIILREFWLKSDDKLKRHFFGCMKLQNKVLTEIIELDKFSYLDYRNFTMIVEDATPEEKQKLFDKCGFGICKAAVFRRRFHLALWFLKTCSANRDELISLTRSLLSLSALETTFDYLVQQLKFAKYLLKECFNTEEQISFFIMSPLYSSQQSIVFNLISKDWRAFLVFMGMCFDTNEKLVAFKSNYMNDFSGVFYLLITNSRWHEVELFLTWIFSNEGEIDLFKKYMLFPISGARIITSFIQGGQFLEADKFVHWFGPSEGEVRELKNELILGHQELTDSLIQVLRVNCKTIKDSQQILQGVEEEEEEEEYDDDLSEGEDIYFSDGNSEIEDGNDLKGHPHECIERCGGRFEAVQSIVRWFLTDQHVTLMYRKQFHEKFQSSLMEGGLEISEGLAIFDKVVEQHLQYLVSQ